MLFDEFYTKIAELHKADSPGVRFNDDSEVCFYCGESLDWANRRWRTRGNAAVIEHIFPKTLGGTNHKSNLVWACSECNINKGTKHPLNWLGESSLTIPDDIFFDIIIRILMGYFRIVNDNDSILEGKKKLLAWANMIIETLDDREV